MLTKIFLTKIYFHLLQIYSFLRINPDPETVIYPQSTIKHKTRVKPFYASCKLPPMLYILSLIYFIDTLQEKEIQVL